MKLWTIIISLIISSLTLYGQDAQLFCEQAIFTNGTDGYACYRIPAIVSTSNGDLLAFAEGRVYGCNDFGDVDLVLKRSTDHGVTWGKLSIIVDNGQLQSGNPAPVLDRLDTRYKDGRLFLFYNNGVASEHDTRMGAGLRTVHYMTSTDHGETWSMPTDITTQVHRPNRPDIDPDYNYNEDWRSYANTPGHALQLEKGPKVGRLFVPANHSVGTAQPHFNEYRAHAFYSDDHGQSWQLSPSVDIPSSNESIAVQLSDGSILQNIRQQNGESRQRLVAISEDGGDSWSETYFDSILVSPVCQASIVDYNLPNGIRAILFSNPESRQRRENMTVKMSLDDGRSWPVKRSVRAGASAYSDLVIQQDGLIGLLYEHGNNGGIHYAHFNLSWLLGGSDYQQAPWIRKLIGTTKANGLDFKLSTPIATYPSSLFADNVTAHLRLDYPVSIIHYTIDGTSPNRGSLIYKNSINISKSTNLKAKAYHPDILPSDIIEIDFVKANSFFENIDLVYLTYPPHSKYSGGGARSLFDLKKGNSNFRSDKWMGYQNDNIEIKVRLKEAQQIKSIRISMLSDHGSWIFLPASIELSAKGLKKQLQLEPPQANTPGSQQYLELTTDGVVVDTFTITIKPLEEIPQWHQGSGSAPWMFIDEILID